MVDERSHERGRDKLREVHGERALATVESLGDLGRLIVDVAYGEVYSRPGLTLRERQIASPRWSPRAVRRSCRCTCARPSRRG